VIGEIVRRLDLVRAEALAGQALRRLAQRVHEPVRRVQIDLLIVVAGVIVAPVGAPVLDDALGKGRLVRMFFVEREPMTPK